MKKYQHKVIKFSYALVRGILIIGLSFIIIYPLLLKISSSLMTQKDLFDQTVYWISRQPTLENFKVAFSLMNYPKTFLNSFLLTLLVSTAQLASCLVIGYGFARFKFRGRKLWFALVIAVVLVPPQLIMIPRYLNFRYFNLFGLIPGSGINLLGSFWPFLLISLTGVGLKNGLFIFIMRQYFMGMSSELEEAAYIDGAGPIRTFLTIMVPHAVPAMVIVFLFSFVWQWNDLFYTDLFLPNAELLPHVLKDLSFNYGIVHLTAAERAALLTSEFNSILNNAGIILFIAPLIVLYTFLQRYFIESIEKTGLVE